VTATSSVVAGSVELGAFTVGAASVIVAASVDAGAVAAGGFTAAAVTVTVTATVAAGDVVETVVLWRFSVTASRAGVDPLELDKPYPGEPLLRRLGVPRAKTVLKVGGVYTLVSEPTPQQVAAADEVYLGGRWHVVPEPVKNQLEAAGVPAVFELV